MNLTIKIMIALAVFSKTTWAGQWIELTTDDIKAIQVSQQNSSAEQPAGLYISLKKDIVGEAATYCIRKDFFVVSDPEQMDRVISLYLFAQASQKRLQFWLDNQGNCAAGAPIATRYALLN
jgi:hypothetical protein